MNTESIKEKRGMRMYRNPDGNGRRGSGWYGGFGYEPMPRNTETAAAVIQADRMDIPVIPAADRIRTAAVLTAIHGIRIVILVIPAIPAAGRNAGPGVMW